MIQMLSDNKCDLQLKEKKNVLCYKNIGGVVCEDFDILFHLLA